MGGHKTGGEWRRIITVTVAVHGIQGAGRRDCFAARTGCVRVAAAGRQLRWAWPVCLRLSLTGRWKATPQPQWLALSDDCVYESGIMNNNIDE